MSLEAPGTCSDLKVFDDPFVKNSTVSVVPAIGQNCLANFVIGLGIKRMRSVRQVGPLNVSRTPTACKSVGLGSYRVDSRCTACGQMCEDANYPLFYYPRLYDISEIRASREILTRFQMDTTNYNASSVLVL